MNNFVVGQVTFRSHHSESVSLDIRRRMNVSDMVNSMSSRSLFCIHLPPLIRWLRSHTALPHEIIVTESAIAFLQCLLVQHSTVCFQGGRGGGKVYFWGLPRESFM